MRGGVSPSNPISLGGLFLEAAADYHRANIYELANAAKSRVYAPDIFRCEFIAPRSCGHSNSWDPWHVDLKLALLELPPTSRTAAAAAAAVSAVAAADDDGKGQEHGEQGECE